MGDFFEELGGAFPSDKQDEMWSDIRAIESRIHGAMAASSAKRDGDLCEDL